VAVLVCGAYKTYTLYLRRSSRQADIWSRSRRFSLRFWIWETKDAPLPILYGFCDNDVGGSGSGGGQAKTRLRITL